MLGREHEYAPRAIELSLSGKDLRKASDAGDLQRRPTDGDGDFQTHAKMGARGDQVAAMQRDTPEMNLKPGLDGTAPDELGDLERALGIGLCRVGVLRLQRRLGQGRQD